MKEVTNVKTNASQGTCSGSLHTEAFVQAQTAQSLQQGRAGTCSALLEASGAGSAVVVDLA